MCSPPWGGGSSCDVHFASLPSAWRVRASQPLARTSRLPAHTCAHSHTQAAPSKEKRLSHPSGKMSKKIRPLRVPREDVKRLYLPASLLGKMVLGKLMSGVPGDSLRQTTHRKHSDRSFSRWESLNGSYNYKVTLSLELFFLGREGGKEKKKFPFLLPENL